MGRYGTGLKEQRAGQGDENDRAPARHAVALNPLKIERFDVEIVGRSRLVMHAWSEKARHWIESSKADRKVLNQDKRGAKIDPEGEYEASIYRCADGKPGFPAGAFRSCLIAAAHKDLGIAKTDICKSVFVLADDPETNMVRIASKNGPQMREDICRNTDKSPAVRYRAEFIEWSAKLRIEHDAQIISAETIINLLERAGYGVGIGEHRPEKEGEWGRFEVKRGK